MPPFLKTQRLAMLPATNGVIITDAIKFVQGQMDHLNIQGKKLLQDIKEDKAEAEQKDIEQEKTTNEIISFFR